MGNQFLDLVPAEVPERVLARRQHADAALRRSLDIVVALCALVVLLPLFVVIGLLIYIGNPGPVFFAQSRIGHGGKSFLCYKFRSMVVDAESKLLHLLSVDPAARLEWQRDHKLKDDPRITFFGMFLRRSSLDEIPQLLNVLRGDMSIVGPRPIVLAEVVRYGRYFPDYCSVRPGITGLWQVSGRNNVSYRRRVALDVTYARTRTVMTDLRVIMMTIPAVFAAKGSY